MSLIAAFLWNKSHQSSISMMIVDSDNMQFLLTPRIHYLPRGFFTFRRDARKVINLFFKEIQRLHKTKKKKIAVEFKIVFHAPHISYLSPAKESAFVHKTFHNALKKTKKSIKSLEVKPQLRRRLKGKALKQFKKNITIFIFS